MYTWDAGGEGRGKKETEDLRRSVGGTRKGREWWTGVRVDLTVNRVVTRGGGEWVGRV